MSGEWEAGMGSNFVQDCMMSAGHADAYTAAGKVFTELCGGPLYMIARRIAWVEACDSGVEGLGERMATHIDEAIAVLERLRQAPDVWAYAEDAEDREAAFTEQMDRAIAGFATDEEE